ncbi:MAG: hypothetical protein KBC73_23190 [Burkholderiaceae bacterium]|nr:hypothetical protein [Burkholderiaceae bacterium]
MASDLLSRRSCLRRLAAVPAATSVAPLLGLSACGGGGDAGSAAASSSTASPVQAAQGAASTRGWRMGFGGLPPRFDVATAVQGISLWAPRAEVAAIHEEIPWQALLAGADALALVQAEKLPLVNLYRAHGLKLLFVAELNDGMARELEAPQLRALGRSLAEPAVQAVWRAYVLAVARVLQPDWLCLATETNLVRAAAPAPLYAAVVRAANEAAAELRAAGLARPPQLLTSVQVECAWGRLGVQTGQTGQAGPYVGIASDRRDFGFADALGLSSYPYLAYERPEQIPADHYSRLLDGGSLPVLVSECGWSSAAVGGHAGSLADQSAYWLRHADLLDGIAAQAVVQLLFADLDLAALAQPVGENLPLFAHIGLADAQFGAKPALEVWDRLRGRHLR